MYIEPTWARRNEIAMKLLNTPYCTLCTSKTLGTFFHMTWECQGCYQTIITIPNHISIKCYISKLHKNTSFSWINSNKVVMWWKTPHTLTFQQWALTFLDITYMEFSMDMVHVRRTLIHGLKPQRCFKTYKVLFLGLVYWDIFVCGINRCTYVLLLCTYWYKKNNNVIW